MNKEKLEDAGFIVTPDCDDNYRITFDFSDFELYSAYVSFPKDVSGNNLMCMRDIRLYNPMDKDYHMHIDYRLYYRNMEEFEEFFKRIGYPLPKPIVKNI